MIRTLLEKIKKKRKPCNAAIGFDGFIDDIIHVVDERKNYNEFERISTIEKYAERIVQAAGLSTNIEYVPIKSKIGGNGPIFANALLHYETKIDYIGALGYPDIAPIFKDFATECKVYSLCECAHTDAVEFNDGKLIISKTSAFNDVTYQNIINKVGLDKLVHIYNDAQLIGFVNWTMLPFMTEIIIRFRNDIAPFIQTAPFVFFDLADPQKRTHSDIMQFLECIKSLNGKFRCLLGLNLKEARHIANILGCSVTGMTLEDLCTLIERFMEIYCVIIHPVDKACAIMNGAYCEVEGYYCENPVLTTGAGDNFNAGFCYAIMQGFTLEEALLLGVLTSGYYVRFAKSPSIFNIIDFIKNIS